MKKNAVKFLLVAAVALALAAGVEAVSAWADRTPAAQACPDSPC